MASNIKAILLRRRWTEWARRSVVGATSPPDDEIAKFLAALKRLKSDSGPARSFEHSAVSLDSVSEVMLAALARTGITTLAVIVGDADAPAVITVPVGGSGLLLREAAREGATVALATESADGLLVVDLPNPDQAAGAALVSGTGTLDPIPGELIAALPGGHVFSGN